MPDIILYNCNWGSAIYIDISSYRGINKATILYLGPTNRNHDTKISIIPIQGRSQEFSFAEARLKGKGASNAGVWGAPEADAIHQSHFQYFVEQL